MIYGIILETIITIIFVFIPGLNSALGMRIMPLYFIFPALPFSILLFLWEETRKLLIRNVKSSDKKFKGWFESNSMW